jgi:hypothetical protein
MKVRLALCLLALSVLTHQSGSASAAPLAPHRVADASAAILANGQRVHRHRVHHRAHGHHAKYHHRHRNCRRGWLPPLPKYRHAPGKWSHKHCHDWHRCHYYFYGYKQWARWNPEKSRAYFYRRYHH